MTLNKNLIIPTVQAFLGETGAEPGLDREETAVIYNFSSATATVSVTGQR